MVALCVVLEKIMVNTGGEKSKTAENNNDGNGAFATGNYRNLFAEAGHSQKEITEKINAAFQQLFYGDPNKQAIYYSAGSNANGPLAYIWDVASNDVRSEGMSYGMMIAVQLDKKNEFDAIWNWAKTYMYHDSANHPARGYFSWSVKIDGMPIDEMPAPDGEEYFAMSLYFAANRWGNGTGIYNYKAEADRLLTDMKNREIITNQTVNGLRIAGNIFDDEHKMVRFSPVIEIRDHTDPSYHLPAFYELWARWGPKQDRQFWAQTAAVSRDFFLKTTHPVTGLSPEYANFDGSPWDDSHHSHAIHFFGDAWRTGMNWSMDWAWWGKDIRERELSDRLQAFFESKGLSTYGSQFTLDGNQLNSDCSDGLVAANAIVGLAATNPRAIQFVEALWKRSVPAGQYRYYDGMLYMLAMLNCSGEFRIWSPQ
jgi:oligosaccharide reducing-end xylanase